MRWLPLLLLCGCAGWHVEPGIETAYWESGRQDVESTGLAVSFRLKKDPVVKVDVPPPTVHVEVVPTPYGPMPSPYAEPPPLHDHEFEAPTEALDVVDTVAKRAAELPDVLFAAVVILLIIVGATAAGLAFLWWSRKKPAKP